MANQWVVLKFGGTSVSSVENWEVIASQVRRIQAEGARPLLVCSALSGVSDALEALAQGARQDGQWSDAVEALKARHRRLAEELGVDAAGLLSEEWKRLRRLSKGVALLGDLQPPTMARLMALGELMSTRLGAAYLSGQGLETGWLDAREVLESTTDRSLGSQHFLSTTCGFEPDAALRQRLEARSEGVMVTQGFIASDQEGRTVLLGRGGSDTSAAYMAAKLEARRLEIWTDVPGLFSANPRAVPEARMLRHLDYDEAQELATMGASVLHPRCIPPLREASIPLEVRCTPRPELAGTTISTEADDTPQVKAVSAKAGITAISMDTLGMWQQVGFLADIFAIFKRQGLSVDLVATSESNVTVTLDAMANALEPEVVAALLGELNEVCEARLVEGCAAVSMVGTKIRSILSEVSPALQVFDDQKVHLVSQAASDLNFTLVVDEEQADRLVQKLHALFFEGQREDEVFGPSWQRLAGDEGEVPFPGAWWRQRRQELCELAEEGSPVYVYSQSVLRRQATRLNAMEAVDRVFYAMKANPHEAVLSCFEEEGLGFECVSPGELARVEDVVGDAAVDRVLFTPNFAGREEYEAGFESGAMVTLDNLHPIEEWPEVFAGQEVLVRIDPGQGKGHHRYVRTAGPRSKFGVSPEQLPRVAEVAEDIGLRVMGLHAHVGSGVRQPGTWSQTAQFLESCRRYFPEVQVLNLGGGLGVPERAGEQALDLEAVDEALMAFKETFGDLELWLEPGRYLVSEGGVLLTRVTQLKQKQHLRYVGVDAGMHTLIRPALYGAHHGIFNLSRDGEGPRDIFDVVGPICESGDVLGHGRRLVEPREGDVLLVANCGAYGRAMSSRYNLRPSAREVVLSQKG